MHLFTHLRAKCALLLFGAVLWSGTAWADDETGSETTETTGTWSEVKTWDFVTNYDAEQTITYSSTTEQIGGYDCYYGTDFFEGLAFADAYKVGDSNTYKVYYHYNGLYFFWTGDRSFGILDLKANDRVTITSNMDYSVKAINGTLLSSETENSKYIQQFSVTEAGTLGFSAVRYTILYSIKVERQGVVVKQPSVSITGVDGTSRTITITGEEDCASIKYALSSDGTFADDVTLTDYTDPFSISETQTVRAIAYDANGNPSDPKDVVCAAGTNVTLNGVTISPNGESQIIFTADQSEILCTPTATISYTYTPIDEITGLEGKTTEGTTTSGQSVELGYGTITAYASATGYSSSETSSLTYTPLETEVDWTIDFKSAANSGTVSTGDGAATSGYYVVSISNTTIENLENFVSGFTVSSSASWLNRKTEDKGLRLQAGGNRTFAIQNVKAGQYVILNGHTGKEAFELTLANTTTAENTLYSVPGSKYVYKCTTDGAIEISMRRFSVIETIEVCNDLSGSRTISFDATTGYSTFYWNKTVAIPENTAAYTATLSEDKKYLNLTKITGSIPACTPVILNNTTDESVTVTPAETEVDAVRTALNGVLIAQNTADITDGTVYVLSRQDDAASIGFYQYSGTTLAANKAYLVLPKASSAPVVRFQFGETEGNVTGIEAIEADAQAPVRIFDLQGRSLREAPAKGMYIINGKKVIR